MPYYEFPRDHQESKRSVEFCQANNINPKAPLYGSLFEVTDNNLIITKEFYLQDGRTRIMHEGCCGSTHYAKTQGHYALIVPPEEYGFEAIRTADGDVA